MLTLTKKDIRLGAVVSNKEDAIREVAALLRQSGAIEESYVQSMLEREKVATTYLGNGLAIPHGRPQDADAINETRVAVLQVPAGVSWQDGKVAHLVIGIAAKSDEHIALLRQLTGIVGDAELAKRLANTTDPDEVLNAISLSGEKQADAASGAVNDDFIGSELEVKFQNSRGFHLRPAGKFARAVQGYDGEVTFVVNGHEFSPDSPSRIIGQGISAGDVIRLRVKGENETDTLSTLAALLEEINNEPLEEDDAEAALLTEWHSEQAQGEGIRGVMASPGLALAAAWRWVEADLSTRKRTAGDTDSEVAALRTALETARNQLITLTEGKLNQVQRGLFEAHVSLIEDADLREEVEKEIRTGQDALSSWSKIIEERATAMEGVEDKNLAQRAADFRDIGQRVRKVLLGVDSDPFESVVDPIILLGDDLEPSEAAQLKADKIKGICLKKGSPNAHAAIVSRSLGIPMLVAMGDELDAVAPGDKLILNASGGRLIQNPSEADCASALAVIEEVSVQRDNDWDQRFEPAVLRDGHRVEVVANIGQTSEAHTVLESGAEGVGLVRTEFLFLDRDHAPEEEEQYLALKEMIEALEGLPMIVRTMDIGGDKPVSYLGLSELDLSFLGLRGFRLSMARPDLATAQLRAIFRAAEHGPIRLMFPMIASPNDFLRAREMTDKVRREMGGREVELGVMIEVPSAVAMASELAELADFFSIGTNDLTQYALAADRTHPLLAGRADSLHPAVLRLIEQTVQAAHAKGKWVGVCGGLAADPLGALILTGLGVDELSVPPSLVPQIKALLRREELLGLHKLAQKALSQRDPRAVRALRPSH
ncbi:phosphoenolpyruvate--protein phosphotransferase [Roseibacillus persicicus]|uniref:phosphoenolpyruvate--protein phosphotransferase n=1 Tax=Roseibacillus persicicus TaxID=454148 RepID=A0A918TSM7_9BACT|nr:phosphoenolpyruvate--protein phosphotransferase [Roseibacillus persicicus]GHC61194.1 phosphoenolpyruvate--protein phosphotransferase [Roseibacillus persicicus]